MESLLYGIAVLACPIGMGAMMWVMMRGNHRQSGGDSKGTDQVAELRSEIDQLKAERAAQRAKGGL